MTISGLHTKKVILREVILPKVTEEGSGSQDLNIYWLHSMSSAILKCTEPLLCVQHCTRGSHSHHLLSPHQSPLRCLLFYKWRN